ncbi:hypothetical protein [Halolamina sp.]|jgi:hypothetical protein|uniref:hypothetical protein n=1 Tax=Halolamina sp. TaxID=1940283 RepID=UPI000223B4F3|nr:hypothetical protein Halar_1019 [halophilic archaeon DL31]
MRTELIELAVDLLAILFYAVLSAALTYEGLLSELSGIGQFANGGDPALGVWYLFVGTLALYAGLGLIGRDLLWARLRTRLG